MSVVLFANNRLGLRVADWLVAHGETIAGVVLHPPARARYAEEIRAASRVAADRVWDAATLSDAAVRRGIQSAGAHVGLSVLFGYKLDRALIDGFAGGCFNLHPALLPFNRGADPNVWAIVDGTPAGVTLHWMDDEIDTGDIVAQQQIAVEPIDTGERLYRRLEDASLALLAATWPLVRSGKAPRTPQPAGGTAHRRRDLAAIERVDLDRQYTGRELIDLLRARTFPPYPGMYFERDGRRVRIRVELTDEEQGEPS